MGYVQLESTGKSSWQCIWLTV